MNYEIKPITREDGHVDYEVLLDGKPIEWQGGTHWRSVGEARYASQQHLKAYQKPVIIEEDREAMIAAIVKQTREAHEK